MRVPATARDVTPRRTLARAVLLFVPMISGCIVPTPLEQRPATQNHRPQIDPDLASPPFSQPVTHSASDLFTFKIFAFDEDAAKDPADTLLARLLVQRTPGSSQRVQVDDITLTPPTDPLDPYTGTFGGTMGKLYCQRFVTDASTATVTVFVAVSDRGWLDGDSDNTIDNASNRDERFWSVTCTP